MLGGDATVVERVRFALEAFGTIHHCGDVGAGQIAFTTVAIDEEARAMARARVADMNQLMKIVGHSSGRSFVCDNWDYIVANWLLMAPLGKKDVGLRIEAAEAKGVAMPMVDARFSVDCALRHAELG